MVWAVVFVGYCVSRAVGLLLQGGGYEPECSSFCGVVSIRIVLPFFLSLGVLLTGTGDLILGEDCRRRPLTGCWARKTGAARCLSMLKARVDCIVNVCDRGIEEWRRSCSCQSINGMV
jgi:hypothetical protein